MVGVLVGPEVEVRVAVGVIVGVLVGVLMGPLVGVRVAVGVIVRVGVEVKVLVGVFVDCASGAWPGEPPVVLWEMSEKACHEAAVTRPGMERIVNVNVSSNSVAAIQMRCRLVICIFMNSYLNICMVVVVYGASAALHKRQHSPVLGLRPIQAALRQPRRCT
jgi:hypothetical protein